MAKITSGAELVKRLRESGTGEGKLAVARKCLADAADQKKVTAAEVVAALELAGVGELTIEKARTLAETGEWAGPAALRATPIEEQILAAADKTKK